MRREVLDPTPVLRTGQGRQRRPRPRQGPQGLQAERDEDAEILVAIVHPKVCTTRGQCAILGHELVLEVREEEAVDDVLNPKSDSIFI